MMKAKIILLIMLLAPGCMLAQTTTTEALMKKYEGDGTWTAFFYKNTLKMLNQTDNKNFDDMVKNIQKLRFILIDKSRSSFADEDYKKLVSSYKGESFEAAMTSRMNDKTFDVYLKDKPGGAMGTVILVNGETTLYVMDMLGTVDLKRATQFFSDMEKNSDISSKLKSFLNKDDGKDKEKKEREEHEVKAD